MGAHSYTYQVPQCSNSFNSIALFTENFVNIDIGSIDVKLLGTFACANFHVIFCDIRVSKIL